MPPVEFDDLSDDVQHMLAKLEGDMEELKFEANFYRLAVLLAVVILAERVWDRIF